MRHWPHTARARRHVSGRRRRSVGDGHRSGARRAKALTRAGLTVDQIDLWELNEAFASQSIACMRDLQLDPAKVNIYGGAIALGHALGSSGSRHDGDARPRAPPPQGPLRRGRRCASASVRGSRSSWSGQASVTKDIGLGSLAARRRSDTSSQMSNTTTGDELRYAAESARQGAASESGSHIPNATTHASKLMQMRRNVSGLRWRMSCAPMWDTDREARENQRDQRKAARASRVPPTHTRRPSCSTRPDG